MKGSRVLFLTSWIILLVVSAFLLLASLASLGRAYTDPTDELTPTFTLNEIRAAGGEEAVQAFHARRATAASFGVAAALLSGFIVWFAYRRGQRWAWWALLIALGGSQLLSVARYVALGTSSGLGAAATLLAFVLLGLLAGAPRMFAERDEL